MPVPRRSTPGPCTSRRLAPPYRFCPRVRQRARAAPAQGRPSRSAWSARPRCGFVFYLDPKIAVGTIIRIAGRAASCWCGARSSRATASGCFPAATSIAARRSAGGRHPRSARGVAASTSASTAWSTSTRTPAARRSSSSTRRRRSAATLAVDDEGLEARSSSRRPFRGTSWRSAARARRCATIWPAASAAASRRACRRSTACAARSGCLSRASPSAFSRRR